MFAATIPSGLWVFMGGVVGVVAKGIFDLRQSRQTAEIEKRKFGSGLSAEPAKVVFDAQQAALVMSEQMRHDLRDQVERCQGEIQDLKDANDKLDDRLKSQATENAQALDGYRKRIEVLEEELDDMSERLRREGGQQK